MHKKIAVLVTYDFEDAEYAEPVEAFRAAPPLTKVSMMPPCMTSMHYSFLAVFRQINCAKMNAISYLSGTLQTCKNPFYAVPMPQKF